jgi:hypothetical protein
MAKLLYTEKGHPKFCNFGCPFATADNQLELSMPSIKFPSPGFTGEIQVPESNLYDVLNYFWYSL